jgi:hypothetical protein
MRPPSSHGGEVTKLDSGNRNYGVTGVSISYAGLNAWNGCAP